MISKIKKVTHNKHTQSINIFITTYPQIFIYINIFINYTYFLLKKSPKYINNKLVIKSGTLVVGQVVKLKNNSILGIPGEIQIGNFRISDSNQIINLRGNITNKGTNRAWVNVGWFFWVALPLLFVKGNDGKISAGTYHTVGLKSDGTVVATGSNEFGQCDVSDWKLW